MGAVIQSRALVKNDRAAIWPDSKLTFVGYTQEGYQMRVYWFAGIVSLTREGRD